ncbi:transposase [Candidatus Poribacteria bacterium]|nr:transposase [Candidatus Poribacteria bacterium]
MSIPKANLYRHLKGFSVYQWKSLLVRIGCSIAIQEIRETESKSASTKSRRCITISVDDTNVSRYGKLLSYCYNWWSKKHNSTIRGQNVLGITIKIGNMIIPLTIRIVGKQGRGNTDKPRLFHTMLKEVLDIFDAQGIDLRQYPITFDSWYGSKRLIQNLSELGFDRILFHGKSNYVMKINNENIKLSQHKKQIDLKPKRWVCNKPHYRYPSYKSNIRQTGDTVLLRCG